MSRFAFNLVSFGIILNQHYAGASDGYYHQLLIKRRRLSGDSLDQYIDCSFCVATSSTVERLFSSCKHVLKDEHKCMSPIIFEALIFLKENKAFWDLPMVAKVMKNQ